MTEQTAAEELAELKRRLADTEDKLRRTATELVDLEDYYLSAPVGLCLVDIDLRFVRINQQLADINGHSVEDHLGRHLSEMVPQVYDFIEPIYRRVIETGEPALNFEVDGVAPIAPTAKSTFVVSYYPAKNDKGEVVGVNSVVQDITARKKAEQAHQESEQRLQTILDNAPEAIVVFDADTGKFIDWNDNALDLFRIDRDSIPKVGPVDFSPPTQPDGRRSDEAVSALIGQALAGETPVFDWVHLDSTGQEIPCEIRLARMPMTGRKLVRGSITDISERKRVGQALQNAHDELEERVERRTAELTRSTVDLERSEERWRSLVATAPDLILSIAPDGTITYINQVEEGYRRQEVIGTCAYDYVPPESRSAMIDAVEKVVRTGEIVSLELIGIGSDGVAEWYASRMGPYREDGKIVGVTSIATNISRRKKAEERIQTEQRLLRKLLALQESERRMVSHDIHDGLVQYVVGAQMYLQAIPQPAAGNGEGTSSTDAIDSYLQKAIAEGRRLIRDLRPMVLDESGIVESLTHLIADEEKNERMTVAFEHDVQFDRLEPTLEGAIFRIVQESLSNVKQHSQVRHAGVQLIQDNDILRISIRDQGIGFDPKKTPPDRFGLQGIYERARLFGGTATIETKIGKGTSILVQLPIALSPRDTEE